MKILLWGYIVLVKIFKLFKLWYMHIYAYTLKFTALHWSSGNHNLRLSLSNSFIHNSNTKRKHFHRRLFPSSATVGYRWDESNGSEKTSVSLDPLHLPIYLSVMQSFIKFYKETNTWYLLSTYITLKIKNCSLLELHFIHTFFFIKLYFITNINHEVLLNFGIP